jgi:hypothetical protein
MDTFTNLFKKENVGQVVLILLFIIYLIMGYQTPEPLASAIDTIYGKVIIILIAISLFLYANPVLGVLGFFVAFDLIRRSTMTTGTYALEKYMPTEKKKATNLSYYNQFPYTLEQEVVKKMAPAKSGPDLMGSAPSYTPILDNLYDAAPLNYQGVI